MKKNYTSPDYKITLFSEKDILVTSVEGVNDLNKDGDGDVVIGDFNVPQK